MSSERESFEKRARTVKKTIIAVGHFFLVLALAGTFLLFRGELN